MLFNCQRIFFFVWDQSPPVKRWPLSLTWIYILCYFVLEHCEESGEERGQRLAPGDQGDPQRGKEGKFMTPFHFLFQSVQEKKISWNFLNFTQLSICGMPSFLQNILNCNIYLSSQSHWFRFYWLYIYIIRLKLQTIIHMLHYFPQWKQNHLCSFLVWQSFKKRKMYILHITFPSF